MIATRQHVGHAADVEQMEVGGAARLDRVHHLGERARDRAGAHAAADQCLLHQVGGDRLIRHRFGRRIGVAAGVIEPPRAQRAARRIDLLVLVARLDRSERLEARSLPAVQRHETKARPRATRHFRATSRPYRMAS